MFSVRLCGGEATAALTSSANAPPFLRLSCRSLTLGLNFHDVERNTILKALKAVPGKIAGPPGPEPGERGPARHSLVDRFRVSGLLCGKGLLTCRLEKTARIWSLYMPVPLLYSLNRSKAPEGGILRGIRESFSWRRKQSPANPSLGQNSR